MSIRIFSVIVVVVKKNMVGHLFVFLYLKINGIFYVLGKIRKML